MSLRDELSLSELIKHLEAGCGAVGPAKMRDILERLVISAEEVRVYALFSDKRYARNLVHKTAQFEIMIMCWHAGQRSSIHDHAGSLGGLKILHGALTESVF
jgi:cysteine dioxygenase